MTTTFLAESHCSQFNAMLKSLGTNLFFIKFIFLLFFYILFHKKTKKTKRKKLVKKSVQIFKCDKYFQIQSAETQTSKHYLL